MTPFPSAGRLFFCCCIRVCVRLCASVQNQLSLSRFPANTEQRSAGRGLSHPD